MAFCTEVTKEKVGGARALHDEKNPESIRKVYGQYTGTASQSEFTRTHAHACGLFGQCITTVSVFTPAQGGAVFFSSGSGTSQLLVVTAVGLFKLKE